MEARQSGGSAELAAAVGRCAHQAGDNVQCGNADGRAAGAGVEKATDTTSQPVPPT